MLRQSEVEDLQASIVGEEQILGLEIAMDDAALVSGGQAFENLARVVDGPERREMPRVFQTVAQRLTLEQFRDGVDET